MKKHEAAFQQVFGRFLQYAWTGPSIAFELKRPLGHSLPFSEFRPQQLGSLEQAETGLYYKIPDDSLGPKPFDGIFLRNVPGYVVVAYGRQLQGFYMLPIENVMAHREAGNVSISEEDADVLGDYYSIPKTKRRAPD